VLQLELTDGEGLVPSLTAAATEVV
jgi:hypothetical protein